MPHTPRRWGGPGRWMQVGAGQGLDRGGARIWVGWGNTVVETVPGYY